MGETTQQESYIQNSSPDFSTHLLDLEEKQRLLRDRVLLIGKNLIESKERMETDITEIKLILTALQEDTRKIKDSILRISEELENKSRKTDVEILVKQMKMFQPMIRR